MMNQNFKMTDAACGAWKKWVKRVLQKANSTQSSVAAELFDVGTDGSPKKTTEVYRFVSGDPQALERWFVFFPKRVETFAKEVDLTVEAVREKLRGLVTGEAHEHAPWHQSFGEVPAEEAWIPTPLIKTGQRMTPEELAGAIVKQWKAKKKTRVRLCAEPGRRADVARDQIVEALRHALSKKSGDEEKSRPDVVLVSSADEGIEGRIEVELSRGNLKDNDVTLAPWGAAEAIALALRLADNKRLKRQHREALRGFAERVGDEPGWVGPDFPPDLLIRWLGSVARKGCPATASAARKLMTDASWQRVLRRTTPGPLDSLPERLLEHFFTATALRVRSSAEAGPWTAISRVEALGLLRESLTSVLGPAAGRPILDLVNNVINARKSVRDEARQTLEAVLAAEPAEAVLDALVAGGLFVMDKETLRPVEPRFSAIYAARGIGDSLELEGAWDRLLDPHWRTVVEELGRHKGKWKTLVRALDGAPPELALDAAAWKLAFATTSSEKIQGPALTEAWAAVLWGTAHGVFASGPYLMMNSAWGRWAKPLLAAASKKLRHVLPLMGEHPEDEVKRHVPEVVRRLVERWGSPAGVELAEVLCGASPYQVDPIIGWRWWTAKSSTLRLEELACTGDIRARQHLCGSAFAAERLATSSFHEHPPRPRPAEELWRCCPVETRLKWARMHAPAGMAGSIIFFSLLRALTGPRDIFETASTIDGDHPHFDALVEIGVRVGAADMERMVRSGLLTDNTGELPSTLCWRLIEELDLRELAREIVSLPSTRRPHLALELDKCLRVTLSWGDSPADCLPITPTWTPEGRLDIESVLDGWTKSALCAARILYRLGEPEPLLNAWNSPDISGPPLSLLQNRAQIEGALILFGEQGRQIFRREGMPLSALAAYDAGDFDLRIWELVGGATWLIAAAHDPLLREDVRAALRGLGALLVQWPKERSDELARAFEQISMRCPTLEILNSPDALELHIDTVASALLEEGDSSPLIRWAEKSTESVSCGTSRAVERWRGGERSRIDRCWEAFKKSPLDGEARLTIEWRLLSEGSASRDGRDGPRPFVIEVGQSTDNVELIGRMTEANKHHRAWFPVLRRHRGLAQDGRTRAWWSLQIARLSNEAEELNKALRYWLHEDSAPFSGGWRWSKSVPGVWTSDGRWHGGATELLEAAISQLDRFEADDPARANHVNGLKRLWCELWLLPWSKGILWRERPADWPRGWLEQTNDYRSPPPVLQLANALVDADCAQVVVDTWMRPPVDESGLDEADRRRKIGVWLHKWGLVHASDADLRSRLQAWKPGAPLFGEAEELIERGALGLEELVIRVAKEGEPYRIGILCKAAPLRVVDVVREKATDANHKILGEIFRELSVVKHVHVGGLREARRVLFERDLDEEGP